jgi:hypothetical protein
MAAATKIVIVAGQEFSVPAETDNEAIRSQLTTMGFADVASATVQKGKRKVDDEEFETVEFVKKAGTKGLSGAELAALLGQMVPAATARQTSQADRAARPLVERYLAGELPIGEMLGRREELTAALVRIEEEQGGRAKSEGEVLCEPCDLLPAVAAPAPCAW